MYIYTYILIEARINMAWRKFMGMRSELCCKAYPLRKRFFLFGATMSRSFLYAAGTWALLEERVKTRRAAQRRMIRAMLGQGRQVRKKRRKSEEASSQSSSGRRRRRRRCRRRIRALVRMGTESDKNGRGGDAKGFRLRLGVCCQAADLKAFRAHSSQK